MTIDRKSLPPDAIVTCSFDSKPHALCKNPDIVRAFVPVPDGMTYADAEAALADAGAWVEVDDFPYPPIGARVREEYLFRTPDGPMRTYVHRDDLPPTDPDAELVEKMARGMCNERHEGGWDRALPNTREKFRRAARAALTVVREHEATR